MEKYTGQTQIIKEENTWSVLKQVARESARKMLQLALENEVREFVKKYSNITSENGMKVMTKRENMLKTIKRDNPEWIPYRYDGSLTLLRPSIVVKKEEGGKDDWGVMWLPTIGAEGCYTDGKPVISIDEVNNFSAPITDFNMVTKDLKRLMSLLDDKDTITIGYCDFALFERAQFLLGTMDFLIDIFENTQKVEILLDKITDYHLNLTESMMKAGVDGVRFCDDWGMQSAMFIDPDLWRKTIKPHMKILYKAVKIYGGIVWQHSCGHIEEIVPDLIELGIDIIDPCQPAANDVLMWKRAWGDKLTFLGGIDTQSYLSFGTVKEVKTKVKEFVKYMSAGGGYIASPSHTISIPEDNKKAMIEAIKEINQNF